MCEDRCLNEGRRNLYIFQSDTDGEKYLT